jgi:hypothetical protein
MSTPATADLGSDEEDVDYVPTSPKRKTAKRRRSGLSSSSTSSGHDEVDEVEVKRSKLVAENERRLKAAEAFAAMREEGVERSSREADKLEKEEMEMVEVKRARRFAGETS